MASTSSNLLYDAPHDIQVSIWKSYFSNIVLKEFKARACKEYTFINKKWVDVLYTKHRAHLYDFYCCNNIVQSLNFKTKNIKIIFNKDNNIRYMFMVEYDKNKDALKRNCEENNLSIKGTMKILSNRLTHL